MIITGTILVVCPHCGEDRKIFLENHEVKPYAFRKNIYCEKTDGDFGCNKDFAVSIELECMAHIKKTKIEYTTTEHKQIF